MQHILLSAPTKGPQPAELGICIGFSAPSAALWGFGSSFPVGCDPKDKASGKGCLESSGHGQSQLLCLHCSGGDQKMLVLRKRRVPGQLFTPSPRHPDTRKHETQSDGLEEVVQPSLGCPLRPGAWPGTLHNRKQAAVKKESTRLSEQLETP